MELFYNQTQEEYEKWLQDKIDQEIADRENEIRFNTFLEYTLYLIIIGVLGSVYFIYKKGKRQIDVDQIVKNYLRKRKRK